MAILFAVGAAAVVVLFALDLWTGSVGLSFAQVWDALFGVGGAGDAVGAAVGGAGDAVGAVSDSAGIGDAASRVSGAVSGVADETAAYIVRGFRLPKAVVALLAGAALGASGLQMQTLFRNPLAGPYVLGISSGASLGVALFLLGAPLFALAGTGLGEAVRSVGVVGAAWIGAGLIFLLVAAASRRIKDIMAILIIGMMLGSAAGAVVEVLQYFSDQGAVKSFVVWTMGSLGGVTAGQLRVMAPVVVAALTGALALTKPLDALMLGENYARTMGVNVRRTRNLVFVNTTLLAGTVTAFCGPIGFLGLAAPHIARMLSGEARHGVLMPASMILGAAIMLGCDVLSGSVGTTPLPINTITALVGIPVVVMVVLRGRR